MMLDRRRYDPRGPNIHITPKEALKISKEKKIDLVEPKMEGVFY